jgi:hypothetical protein
MYYLKTLVTSDEAFVFYRSPAGDSTIPESEQEIADLELDVMHEILTEPLLQCSVFNEVRRILKTDVKVTLYNGQKHLVLAAIKRYMLQNKKWEPSRKLHERAKHFLYKIELECKEAYKRAEMSKLKYALMTFAELGAVHLGYITTVAEDDANEFISKYPITHFRPYLSPENQVTRKRNDVLRWLARNFSICREVFTKDELAIIDDTRKKSAVAESDVAV